MTNSVFSFHKYYVLGVICDIFYFLYVLVKDFLFYHSVGILLVSPSSSECLMPYYKFYNCQKLTNQ